MQSNTLPSQSSVLQTSSIFTTPRISALASLRSGQRLTVKVLDLLDGDNVMLSIKGTPVTVKSNLGPVQPGTKIKVQVLTQGETIHLRRLPQSDFQRETLRAMVRVGLSKNLISAEALTGLDEWEQQAGARPLPKLIQTPISLARVLMPEIPRAEQIERLFALFGLKGATGMQRLLDEKGERSLYAALRRLSEAPVSRFRELAAEFGLGGIEPIQEILKKGAVVKRAIEVIRSANLLAEQSDGPLVLPVPFGPPGGRRLAHLFFRKGGSGNNSEQSEKQFTVYIKLNFSVLGQVRALIRKGTGPFEMRFFVDEKMQKLLSARCSQLGAVLESAGCPARISVGVIGEEQPPVPEWQDYLVELAGKPGGLKVTA